MITFEPLRNILKSRNMTANRLYSDGIITTNVATAINNDYPISFGNLAKICRHLDIEIPDAIKLIDN